MLGSGLLKGLGVTARNLVGSFHDPERLVTVEYPEQKPRIAENYRNFPFLVYDGDKTFDGLRCVACKICEVECPPQCIYIIPDRDEKGRPTKKPKVFDIDVSVCMSCQICVEVCPFDAIKMDQHFEIAEPERFEALLLDREALAKSNEYYHQIHPTEATEVDAMLAEDKRKADEKAKAAAQAAAAKAAAPKPAPATAPSTGSTPPTGAMKPATSSTPTSGTPVASAGSNSPAAPSAEAEKRPPAAA